MNLERINNRTFARYKGKAVAINKSWNASVNPRAYREVCEVQYVHGKNKKPFTIHTRCLTEF